jgi:exosortase B
MAVIDTNPMGLSMSPASRRDIAPWLVAGAGLLALYVPTYWNAANGIWKTEDMGHGPIVLAVLAWLFWGVRHRIASAPLRPARGAGGALLAVGLAAYVFGRVFNISSVEFGSHLPIIAALLLLMRGPGALRVAWFPVLYLIFLAPLPGTLVDAVTQPLKHWISVIVVESLHAVGYPIARSGVMITVGQYQLLVADACSGLHSMFSLAALGTLFMYVMDRPSWIHNAIMVATIVPIAFAANIVRVIVLVLVTFHLGDEAGQGFLHGAAGIVLLVVALLLFFAVDALLALFMQRRSRRRAAPTHDA